MPITFPVALDSLVNPTESDYLDTATVYHDVQHADANDAIQALEAKVGIDGSAVSTSLDYKASHHAHTGIGSSQVAYANITGTPSSLPYIVDTKANILARTGDATGQPYFASDTYEVFVHIGSNAYYKVPFALVTEPANPDMGYTQESSRIGYGVDYVSDKLLANVDIGNAADTTNAGTNRAPIRVSESVLQVYLSGAWKDVVTGFRLREDDSGYLVFEHKPTGMSEWLEINSGNSNTLGLNGLPIIQQYGASMGAYPAKLVMDGGTF